MAIPENSTSIADNTGKGHRVSTTGAVSLHSNNDIEFIVAGNLVRTKKARKSIVFRLLLLFHHRILSQSMRISR